MLFTPYELLSICQLRMLEFNVGKKTSNWAQLEKEQVICGRDDVERCH